MSMDSTKPLVEAAHLRIEDRFAMPTTNELAANVGKALPTGYRIAIIGSMAFRSAYGKDLSRRIGDALGRLTDVVMLSGGMSGVAEVAALAFARAREGTSLPRHAVQILPARAEKAFAGPVVEAGTTFEERREVLGRLADVYIVIEGGPGTLHEVTVAVSNNAVVIPVTVTGGVAALVYHSDFHGAVARLREWERLADRQASPAALVDAIMALVHACRGMHSSA